MITIRFSDLAIIALSLVLIGTGAGVLAAKRTDAARMVRLTSANDAMVAQLAQARARCFLRYPYAAPIPIDPD